MAGAATTPKKQRGRPFPKGQSANPSGRPSGCRNKATLLLEKLMEDDGEAVVQSVISAARGGDMVAARLVLERIVPIRKGRVVAMKLPEVEKAEDVVRALGVTVAAMAAGEITPDEAVMIANLLELKRKAIETVEIETRLTAIEQRQGPSR